MLRSQSPEGSQSCQAQCSCSGAPPPSKLVQHLWYYEGSQIELKRANKIRVCCLQTWFTWKKADSSLTYLYISQAAFELKVIETCIHVVTVISSLDKPIAKGAAVGSHWGGHPHHPLRDSTLLFVDHGTYGLRLLEEFAGLKTSTDLESSDLQGKLAAPELDHIDPRRSINLWRVADVGESRGLSCREQSVQYMGKRSGWVTKVLKFSPYTSKFLLLNTSKFPSLWGLWWSLFVSKMCSNCVEQIVPKHD